MAIVARGVLMCDLVGTDLTKYNCSSPKEALSTGAIRTYLGLAPRHRYGFTWLI